MRLRHHFLEIIRHLFYRQIRHLCRYSTVNKSNCSCSATTIKYKKIRALCPDFLHLMHNFLLYYLNIYYAFTCYVYLIFLISFAIVKFIVYIYVKIKSCDMKTLKNIWEETLFQEKLCNEHTDKHCRHKSLDLVMKGCGIEWIKKGRVGALF